MAAPEKHDEQEKDSRQRRLRQRNWAMLAVLGGLAVLFYVITIVKMSGGE
ncbi:MAG TPA: hypothetical protein VLN73_03530 [Alphaproteobacteria bacterium]|nr:hypothetical protein [Alphaproteobacteria bacterium]